MESSNSKWIYTTRLYDNQAEQYRFRHHKQAVKKEKENNHKSTSMFHGEAHLLFTYREKQLCFHTEAHLCFTFVKSTKTQLRFKPKHYRISLLKKKTLKHNCASCRSTCVVKFLGKHNYAEGPSCETFDLLI